MDRWLAVIGFVGFVYSIFSLGNRWGYKRGRRDLLASYLLYDVRDEIDDPARKGVNS